MDTPPRGAGINIPFNLHNKQPVGDSSGGSTRGSVGGGGGGGEATSMAVYIGPPAPLCTVSAGRGAVRRSGSVISRRSSSLVWTSPGVLPAMDSMMGVGGNWDTVNRPV